MLFLMRLTYAEDCDVVIIYVTYVYFCFTLLSPYYEDQSIDPGTNIFAPSSSPSHSPGAYNVLMFRVCVVQVHPIRSPGTYDHSDEFSRQHQSVRECPTAGRRMTTPFTYQSFLFQLSHLLSPFPLSLSELYGDQSHTPNFPSSCF
jgi:hypothetical protein